MTTDCDAEVRAKRTPATAPDGWRPCHNLAAGVYRGAALCVQHLGIAVSGRPVMLQDGRIVCDRRPVNGEGRTDG